MMRAPFAAVAIAAVGSAAPAQALDARIQLIPYCGDCLTTLRVGAGFALVVELSPEEHVENVVVGNSTGWQVTVNRKGDHLIVKPLAGATTTDLVAITDQRRYVFLLQPAGSFEQTPFLARITFPQPAPPPMLATPAAPVTYRLRGDRGLFPLVIGDDGRRTVMRWAANVPLPAVLAVDDRGKEVMVNGRMQDGDFVIEGIAKGYVFRRGPRHAAASRRPVRVPSDG